MIEDDDLALLERRYALETEAASIRLTLARRYLLDDKWKIHSEFRWYRRVPGYQSEWMFNIASDILQFGRKGGMIRNAFEWLLLAKEDGRLEGEKPLVPVGTTKMFKPNYRLEHLPGNLKKAHYRVPPPTDWLCSRYGWDEDLKAFFHVENEQLVYQMPGDFVVLEDGILYATWRVKSMLLFGNPEGKADVELHRAILADAPNMDTGIGEAIRAPASRARQLTEAAIAKERVVRVRPVLTLEEKRKRVIEIKKEQERKRLRAEADALLAKFEQEVYPRRRVRNIARSATWWRKIKGLPL